MFASASEDLGRDAPSQELEILRPAQDDSLESAARQLFVCQYQPLDASVGRNRLYDFGHVRQRHVAIKEMIGFNQDADAARALIETTRLAGTRAEPGQAAFLQLLLERGADFF